MSVWKGGKRTARAGMRAGNTACIQTFAFQIKCEQDGRENAIGLVRNRIVYSETAGIAGLCQF